MERCAIPPHLWNVYERTIAEEPRTNNILEGWHRRFNTIVAKHHPNIYEFLERLKGEQAHTDTLVVQLIAGQQPQQPRMKVCMVPIMYNLNIAAELKIQVYKYWLFLFPDEERK